MLYNNLFIESKRLNQLLNEFSDSYCQIYLVLI